MSERTKTTGMTHQQETENFLGREEDDEIHDDRPLDDWCRVNGWNHSRCCPVCGGSGMYDDITPCSECDEGLIDWP